MFNFLPWLMWSKLWNFFRNVAPLIRPVGIPNTLGKNRKKENIQKLLQVIEL